ncbi:MAG: hypothetical protein VB135_00390 [Burkholderia sp.]|nr:hypothetical protein [Stenotrophomonas pavanii]
MTTLKYLSLPDLATRGPERLTTHLGHLDAAAISAWELVQPRLRHGLHAWIRGTAPADPTWTEMQRLTDAVRGFSREFLIGGAICEHVTRTPTREPLLYRLDAHRRRPYPIDAHANLHETMATWLRTAGDDDVLLTLDLHLSPQNDALADVLGELRSALQLLSSNSPAESPTSATRHVPDETEASAAARRAAIDGWLTAAQAGTRIPGPTRAPAQRASRMARLGQLFCVWVPEERAHRYAPWQFMQSGRPSPILPEILALVRGPNGVAAGERTSGWEELEWFMAPHALADGRTPAQLLATDPPAILKVAHADFDEGADDARW